MPHHPYKALYLHIPFCLSRCAYCDFITQAIPRESAQIDEYIEHLILEIRRFSKEGELQDIESLYIGGGTPTHLGSARLLSLLYAISTSLYCSDKDFEFTVEANPESLSENLVKDVWALGVNRLSLGVQSLNDRTLQVLGRAHSADDARRALEHALERFKNVSVDIICGIPGQTEEELQKTLHELIQYGVTHFSVYPLTIEHGTPLYRRTLSGEFQEIDEDAQANHMLLVRDLLETANYKHYEVASYALSGFESKHNSVYWKGLPYLGLGMGATTMTQNDERRMRILNNEVIDDLTKPQMEAEDLMLGMRMSEGITEQRLSQALRYLPKAQKVFEELVEKGLVIFDGASYIPTELGWLCGNELYLSLLELAD